MECPYKCGWTGTPEEYSKHYETCPKRPRTPGKHSSPEEGSEKLTVEERALHLALHKMFSEKAIDWKAIDVIQVPTGYRVEVYFEFPLNATERSLLETSLTTVAQDLGYATRETSVTPYRATSWFMWTAAHHSSPEMPTSPNKVLINKFVAKIKFDLGKRTIDVYDKQGSNLWGVAESGGTYSEPNEVAINDFVSTIKFDLEAGTIDVYGRDEHILWGVAEKVISPQQPHFTAGHIEKLLKFRSYADKPEFVRLFTAAGGSQDLANHLWRKYYDYDYDIVKWYSELDPENRTRFAEMLNHWTAPLPGSFRR